MLNRERAALPTANLGSATHRFEAEQLSQDALFCLLIVLLHHVSPWPGNLLKFCEFIVKTLDQYFTNSSAIF